MSPHSRASALHLGWWVATLGVALLATSACSGGAGPGNARPETAAAATAAAAAGINGPLRAVLQADTDFVTSETAQRRAGERVSTACMKEKGYSAYAPPVIDTDQIRRDGLTLAYGTTLADDATRAKEGYGVTGGLVGLRSVGEAPPVDAYNTRGMSANEKAAFERDLSACEDKAAAEALPRTLIDEISRQSAQAEQRVEADPQVAAARTAWAACMKKGGHPYRTPEEPQLDFDTRARPLYTAAAVNSAPARSLHDEEIATAELDWACREKTINPALTQARNTYETQFIEQHPDLVARVRAEMKKIIAP